MTEPVVVRAGRLIDAVSPEPLRDAAVRIENGVITAAGPAREVPVTGATLLDLGDRTLMPGMIDAHVHLTGYRTYAEIETAPQLYRQDLAVLRAAMDCQRLLRSGFTTVRDVGSAIAPALRRAVQEGTLAGPQIHAAGPIICQTGGHADNPAIPLRQAAARRDAIIADTPDGCRTAVRRAIRAGADLIKVCTSGGIGSEGDDPHDAHFTPEEITAMTGEAHRHGRRVAAHAQGRQAVLNAVRCGVDTIEHGYWLDEECAAEMLAHDTVFVPTLALAGVFEQSARALHDMPEWRLAKQQHAINAMRDSFRLAYHRGVTIAAGSDYFGAPMRAHGANADEPIAMVAAGMTEMDAIRAVTDGSARAIGIQHQSGRIRAGLRADLIAVDGDPAVDITALRAVSFVMTAGNIVRQADC